MGVVDPSSGKSVKIDKIKASSLSQGSLELESSLAPTPGELIQVSTIASFHFLSYLILFSSSFPQWATPNLESMQKRNQRLNL